MRASTIRTFLLVLFADISISTPPLDSDAIAACGTAVSTIKCIDDGTRYVNCNGKFSVSQPLAAGQICINGLIVAKNGQSLVSNPATTASSQKASPTSSAQKPSSSPSSTKPSSTTSSLSKPASSSTAAPDPKKYCLQGGTIAGPSPMQDQCGKPGSDFECRSMNVYVTCNIGPAYQCILPKGKDCSYTRNGVTFPFSASFSF